MDISFTVYLLQEQMERLLQRYSISDELLAELHELREENKRLKKKFWRNSPPTPDIK